MTATELKTRATALMNRLNALGFLKDGKPLVIDQAFELVASEEGFRNQHVLRTKLEPEDQSSEVAAHFDWKSIVARQGWNEESQLIHAMGFIADQGLMLDFVAYAEKVADEENAFGDSMNTEDIQDLLTEMGYSLATSDFGKPYWEFEGEASVDFDDEEAAWADAWEDAQNRMVPTIGMARSVWDAMTQEARMAVIRANLSPVEDEDRCSECGKPLDLDGWDGRCGDCADREENRSAEATARKVADDAYEAYDFGATVVGDSGWETSTGWTTWARTVFLEDTDPAAPSVRARFTVEIVDGKVENITVSCKL